MYYMCLEVRDLTKLKTSTLQCLGRSSGNCRREAAALFDRKGTSGTPVEMQQSKFLLVSAQAMPPFSQSHTLQPLNYLSQKKKPRVVRSDSYFALIFPGKPDIITVTCMRYKLTGYICLLSVD